MLHRFMAVLSFLETNTADQEKVVVNTRLLASAAPATLPSMGPETILNLTVLESPKLEYAVKTSTSYTKNHNRK